jgi:hypothetical protein
VFCKPEVTGSIPVRSIVRRCPPELEPARRLHRHTAAFRTFPHRADGAGASWTPYSASIAVPTLDSRQRATHPNSLLAGENPDETGSFKPGPLEVAKRPLALSRNRSSLVESSVKRPLGGGATNDTLERRLRDGE